MIKNIFEINVQGFDTVCFYQGFYVFEAGVSRFKFPGQDKSIALPEIGDRIDLPNGDVAHYKDDMWSVFRIQESEVYRANSVKALPGNEYVFMKDNVSSLWYSPDRAPKIKDKNDTFYGNGYWSKPFTSFYSTEWRHFYRWDKRLLEPDPNKDELKLFNSDAHFDFYDDGTHRILFDFKNERHDFLYSKEGAALCHYPSIRRVNGDLYVATKKKQDTAFLFSVNKEAVIEQDNILHRVLVQGQSMGIELDSQRTNRLIDWMMILASLKSAHGIKRREVSHAENLATHYYMTQLGLRTY